MKIAILILAHKNRNQLQKLIEILQPDFDIYLHLDKKSDLVINDFMQYPNVYCIKEYAVNWGSYNGILAPMKLFMMAAEKDYDFYLHISGQDLPIKSNNEIRTFFENHTDTSFMDWHKLPWDIWGEDGGLGRIQYFWEHNYANTLTDTIKKLFIKIIRKAQFTFDIRKKLPDITFYGGSNWVNLNKEAGKYLANYLKNNPNYPNIFKYSVNADEIWIQTILKNNDIGLKFDIDYLRYVDWSQSKTSPKTLTIEDLPKLKESKQLFARKFDETVDEEVISEIIKTRKCC